VKTTAVRHNNAFRSSLYKRRVKVAVALSIVRNGESSSFNNPFK